MRQPGHATGTAGEEAKHGPPFLGEGERPIIYIAVKKSRISITSDRARSGIRYLATCNSKLSLVLRHLGVDALGPGRDAAGQVVDLAESRLL